MQKLGMKVSYQEAMEMLWEADEDRAGQALAAQDLVDLYFRVATDTSGYEPRRRVPMICPVLLDLRHRYDPIICGLLFVAAVPKQAFQFGRVPSIFCPCSTKHDSSLLMAIQQ